MRGIVTILLFLFSLLSSAQRTDNPYVATQNEKEMKVDWVEITDKATVVSITFSGKGDGFWTEVKTVGISSHTTLVTSDGYNEYTFPIRALSDGTQFLALDKFYSVPGKKITIVLICFLTKYLRDAHRFISVKTLTEAGYGVV